MRVQSMELTKTYTIICRIGRIIFLLFSQGIIQELEEYFLHYLDNGEENKFLAAMILKLSV